LPVLVEAAGENAQSRFIAQKILELREEGIPLDEMAVLFRSSFHPSILKLSCRVPGYRSSSEADEVHRHSAREGLLAHLRVVANPLDTVSWHRALMLIEGVGPKKAQDLLAAIVKADNPYSLCAYERRGQVPGTQGPRADTRYGLSAFTIAANRS